jgi:transposase-like protein
MSGRPVPAGTAAQIAAAYAAGATLAAVGERYEMGPATVARIVREQGGTIRPPHNQGPGTDPSALAAAYAQACSLQAAAAQFGISRGAAARVLRNAGYLHLAAIRRPVPAAREIRAAYESGLSVQDCATTFGASGTLIRATLRAVGCDLRRRGGSSLFTAQQAAQIRAAYESGLSTAQCARRFGCHSSTIARAVRAAGGTIRPRGRVPRREPQ